MVDSIRMCRVAHLVQLMRKLAAVAGNLSACDKAVKIIQYTCRVLLWYYNRYFDSDAIDSIENTKMITSNSRKAFRVLRSINHLYKIVDLSSTKYSTIEQETIRIITIVEEMFLTGFYFFENIQFFVTTKLLTTVDTNSMRTKSTLFVFIADIARVTRLTLSLRRCQRMLKDATEQLARLRGVKDLSVATSATPSSITLEEPVAPVSVVPVSFVPVSQLLLELSPSHSTGTGTGSCISEEVVIQRQSIHRSDNTATTSDVIHISGSSSCSGSSSRGGGSGSRPTETAVSGEEPSSEASSFSAEKEERKSYAAGRTTTTTTTTTTTLIHHQVEDEALPVVEERVENNQNAFDSTHAPTEHKVGPRNMIRNTSHNSGNSNNNRSIQADDDSTGGLRNRRTVSPQEQQQQQQYLPSTSSSSSAIKTQCVSVQTHSHSTATVPLNSSSASTTAAEAVAEIPTTKCLATTASGSSTAAIMSSSETTMQWQHEQHNMPPRKQIPEMRVPIKIPRIRMVDQNNDMMQQHTLLISAPEEDDDDDDIQHQPAQHHHQQHNSDSRNDTNHHHHNDHSQEERSVHHEISELIYEQRRLTIELTMASIELAVSANYHPINIWTKIVGKKVLTEGHEGIIGIISAINVLRNIWISS